MGDPAGAHNGDLLGHGIGRAPHRLAKGPGAVQWRQRRTLTVDVDRDNGQLVLGRQEMQRHHNAMIKLPFFRIRGINGLHDLRDQSAAEIRRARDGGFRDLEPVGILDGPRITLADADTVGRHIIHEEVAEMFRRQHA